jgi:hypothetical protein
MESGKLKLVYNPFSNLYFLLPLSIFHKPFSIVQDLVLKHIPAFVLFSLQIFHAIVQVPFAVFACFLIYLFLNDRRIDEKTKLYRFW